MIRGERPCRKPSSPRLSKYLRQGKKEKREEKAPVIFFLAKICIFVNVIVETVMNFPPELSLKDWKRKHVFDT